ncbi:26S proteasome regulatory subunit N6 [Angomonas deanei]|nr:26S proteasome regulatory subunit N6 [Angomonas deanei]|eukprot:EPY42359.1 26S proteasome regulatory subunit N6 [Angomonas deanei]
MLFEMKEYREALSHLIVLLREVRRLDDRNLLLDIHLLETKIYYAIRNTGKAKAALVSARTTANSIYCPPLSQAEIDLQSGVLHAEEYDYKTAFSYLYESFEGYHGLGDQARLARKALVYMLMAKIQTDQTDELKALLSSKNVLEYRGEDVDAIRGVADAYGQQDTHKFNLILQGLRDKTHTPNGEVDLLQDEVVRRQLEEMYDTLMERHLLRIIKPYNRVQIAYLGELLQLEERTIESRLSKLILDKRLDGIVDQRHNCLLVFDSYEKAKKEAEKKKQMEFYENAADAAGKEKILNTSLYQDALEALEGYDTLVTALFDKVGGKFDALVEENIEKRKEHRKKNERDAEDAKKKKNGEEKKADADADKKK